MFRARWGWTRGWGGFFAAIALLLATVVVPVAGAGPAAAAGCTPDPTVGAPVLTPLDTHIPSTSVTYGEVVKVQTTVSVACPISATLAVTQVLSAGLVWLANSAGLVGVSSSSTGFGSNDPLTGALLASNPVTASTLTVMIPPVTPAGTPPVSPAATILLTAEAIVAHPATGPFTDQATAGASTATSAGLGLVSPPSTYTMAKTANPTLNVPAGTDVAFTVSATPTVPAQASPAYDVTITDTLPAGFTLDGSADLSTAVTDTGTCAGTMATPTLAGQALTMTWAGPVPANCALSVAYSGVFATSASVHSTNTASLSDQSQPGAGVQSVITGAGDTSPALFSSGPATASVCTAAPTFGSAAVQITTDQADIPVPGVTVGEEVAFTATVNIPCAATATVVETLDSGLVWMAAKTKGVLVPVDASSSGTNLPAPTDPTKFMQTAVVSGGSGTVLTIPLGALNPSGSGSVITLTASALVEDTAAVKSGTALNDSFSMNWGAATPATKTATVNVVEPDLTSFTKTASATVVNQPPNPAVNYSIAADFGATGSPAYGMVLKDGLTPDLTIQSMSDTTTPAVCKAADGITLPAAAPFPSNATGGITLDPNPLPTTATGACQLSIAYTGQFAANAAVNQTNSATLIYQSLPSSLAKTSDATPSGTSTAPRVYNSAQSQTTTQINSASVTATYGLTSTNVSIGEEIPIALNVSLPRGGAQGVSVTYALPAGMAFASVNGSLAGLTETLNGATVAPTAVALTSPATSVTLNLGKITAGGAGGFPTLTLGFDAIVLDSTPPPTTLTGGGATLAFCDPSLATCPSPNPLTTPSGSPGDLTVVTPVLTEATLMSPPSVQPGDPVTFTIALSHDEPSSTGDAHDVTVTIPLSGWTLVGQCTEIDNLGAMAACSQDVSGDVVVHYNDHTGPGGLIAAIPTTAPIINGPPNGQAKFTFTASAPSTTPPSGEVTTTWESAASLSNQGLDTGQVNADAHPHTSTVHGGDFSLGVTAPTVTKTVSDPTLTGGNAAIGDQVVYTVTFTLPHLPGTSHGLTLTDTMGPGLAFADTPAPASPCGSGPVAGSISAGNPALVTTTSLPAFSCALAAANVQLTKPGDPSSGSTLVLSLGDVHNADTTTTDETITFTYTAIVLDTPANKETTQVTNSVAMAYTDDAGVPQPAVSQTSTLTIVEPSLTLDDQAQPLPADAGVNGPDLAGVRYQMTVTNNSTTATAFNVIIGQQIPAGLNLDPDIALCNAAFVAPPSTVAVPTPVTCTATPIGATKAFNMTASPIGPLPPGQQIVFSYTIDVIPGFFPSAITLPATPATVDWTSQSALPVALTANGPPDPAGSTYAKERTGFINPPSAVAGPAPIPVVDDYHTTGSSVVTLTLAALGLAAPSPAAAPVGSEITMTATVTLPEAFTAPAPAPRRLTGFDLQVSLPTGLCYETGSMTSVVADNVATAIPADGTVNTVTCKPPAAAGAAVPTPLPGTTNLDFRFGCPATPAPVLPCAGETDVDPVTVTPPPANANTIKISWKVILLTNPGTPTAPGMLTTPASLLLDGHAPVVGTAMVVTAQEPLIKVVTAWGVGQGEPNETAPASVTITNSGTSPANNISTTVAFLNATSPDSVTLSGTGGSCSSPPIPRAGGITFSVGTLAAGASVTCGFSPTIQLPAVLTPGAKATLAASVTTTTLANAADPYDRLEAPVIQQSDLLISLTTVSLSGTLAPVGNPFKPGGPARFTLTISNNSPAGSANATMNALGINLVSPSLPGLVLSPNVGDVAPAAALTWNAFTLAPGAAVTASVNGTVPLTAPAGPVTVTATIAAVNAVNTGMSTIVGSATVQPAVDLVASLSRTGAFVAGVQGTYVLQVTNKGPSGAGAVTLTNTLPNGIVFVNAQGAGWTCKAGITCSLPGLAAGASTSVSVTVVVDLPTGAPVNDSFTVSTANDVNTANNTATDQTTVEPSSAGAPGHGSSVLTGTAASTAAATSAAPGALAMTGAFLRREANLAVVFFGMGAFLAVAPGRRRRRRRRGQTPSPRPSPPSLAGIAPPVAVATVAVPTVAVPADRPRLRRWLVIVGLAALGAFVLGRRRPGPGR